MEDKERNALLNFKFFMDYKDFTDFYYDDAKIIYNLIEKQQAEIEKQNSIIDNAINEVEKVRQYYDDGLQPEFIGILEILKDKKVIDW